MKEVDTVTATPRLMIKEIVLNNFKSYAGEQRVGPFHKCFSAVVGPNGSGKSNVIDAMLFVFGKKAKQLRLNKVSELIHNSTDYRNLEEARVSVHFQEIIDKDGDAYEVVPDSDLVVSRTAHSNNTSNYYINGRKSNFTGVTELLKGKGVDLDNNRFLILQGEVEQISMMKPKAQAPNETGLLEYLEDIIGTDKYVQPIDENYKKLEEISEQRQGMVQRCKVVEKERDGLEDDKLLAESYLGKQRELHLSRAKVAQLYIKAGKVNIETIGESLSKLAERLAYEKQKGADSVKALQEAETKFSVTSEEHQALQKQLTAVQKEFKAYENKDAELRVNIKAKKEDIVKLQDKVAKAGTKRKKTEDELSTLQAAVPELEREAAELSEQLQNAEQVVEQLTVGCRAEVEQLRGQLQGVRQQLAPWDTQITELQSKLSVATAERDLLLKNHTDAQMALKSAEQALKQAESTAKEKAEAVERMRIDVQVQRDLAQSARADEEEGAKEAARLEAALGEVRGRVEQRRVEKASAANQGQVVAALLEAKRKGKITGLHGRLGDLGAVDVKYDIAASTAVAALDYLVVDSTADAQTAVEYLRANGLGVATFLILDKQQHLVNESKQAVQPPEGVPRLFDLVKVSDERLKVAFYYAMRNTLVATDLDQASRIAYGADRRWRRVVTIKGEMINDSGTMTGGGGRPRGGRICLGKAAPRGAVDVKELDKELGQDEQQLQQQQQALQNARQRVSTCAAAAREADKKIQQLETQMAKAQMAAASEAQKAEDIRGRIADLRSKTRMSSSDEERIQALAGEISAVEQELTKVREGAAALHRQADELQSRIDNAGGTELQAAKQKVKDLDKAIAERESEAQRTKVAVKTAEKALLKLDKDASKAAAELEDVKAKLEADQKAFADMEDAAFQVVQQVQECQKLLDAKAAELEGVRAVYEEKSRESSVIRQVESTIKAEMDGLKDSCKQEQAGLKSYEKELQKQKMELQKLAISGDDSLGLYTDEELADITEPQEAAQELNFRATVLEEEMNQMDVNLDTIEQYRRKDAEYQSRLQELEQTTKERDEVKKAYEELRKRRLDEFMAGFHTISLKLKEMYQMITLGGDAELELVDSLDPFSEGIVFSVRPPKKSWKNITNLSGGEKTLSSLSLVFALHHYKPTPLYFMDEIDAALDFKNVSIVAHYIVEKTRGAQFIVISLRNNMFELANRLVGIYKTNNCTKSVAINPGMFVVGQKRVLDENKTADNVMAAA